MTVQSKDDAEALLAFSVRVLAPRQESTKLMAKWRGNYYRVRFDWPGVVTICPEGKTDAVATSAPGHPETLATWSDSP